MQMGSGDIGGSSYNREEPTPTFLRFNSSDDNNIELQTQIEPAINVNEPGPGAFLPGVTKLNSWIAAKDKQITDRPKSKLRNRINPSEGDFLPSVEIPDKNLDDEPTRDSPGLHGREHQDSNRGES